jgi:hypothetical protein
MIIAVNWFACECVVNEMAKTLNLSGSAVIC